MGNIYDGAFRTILNDCRKLVIPLINEIFGEKYTGEEEIQFFPNEHFLDRQGEEDRERITDTNFSIKGKYIKKYHIECESSLPDRKMTIRLFEYDAQIALDEGEVTEETLAVIEAEYKDILDRLDELERQEVIGAFDKRIIIELSGDVIKKIAQKYENVQKGVGDIMRGPMIQTSARTILNQGIQQGIKQGIDQGISEARRETVLKMLKRGKYTVEEIAEDTGLSVAEVEQLAGVQTV